MWAVDNARIESRYVKLLKYICDYVTMMVKIDKDVKTDEILIEKSYQKTI